MTALLVLALALSGCGERDAAEKNPRDQKDAGTKAPAVETSSSDCVRGEPEPLLASQSDFKKSSPGEGYESVRTESSIKLAIRHFGCTHYALDFEFTWPDPQMPPPQVSLKEAANLLEKLSFKTEYQQVMNSLVASLRKMAEEPYKQPLTMSDTETLTATTPALTVLRVRYDVAL